MTGRRGVPEPAIDEQLRQLAERLVAAELSGTGGNGSVVAVVDGFGTLRRVAVTPSAARFTDTERLEQLIVTAVRAAERAAELRREEEKAGLRFDGAPLFPKLSQR
jgi:DNA-binding protein YbaB